MRRERGDEQGKVISLFSALAKATSGVEAVSLGEAAAIVDGA
jgi:hypothetical protein